MLRTLLETAVASHIVRTGQGACVKLLALHLATGLWRQGWLQLVGELAQDRGQLVRPVLPLYGKQVIERLVDTLAQNLLVEVAHGKTLPGCLLR